MCVCQTKSVKSCAMDNNLYTLRWMIDNKWGEKEYKNDAHVLVSKIIGDYQDPNLEEPERPSQAEKNKNSLWYPFAQTNFPKSRVRGDYRHGHPEGAIVHFTAGRRNGLENGLSYQAKQGYTYFLIDKDGNVGQNFPLNKWGYHAGVSYWPNLGSSVSKYLVGIEIQAAGKLDENNKSWFGEVYQEKDVRNILQDKHNINRGRYHKYTEKQEEALINLLLWLKSNNESTFSFDYVLGHDEVSPNRKNDPGGALSMSMPMFRDFLKRKYEKGS